ncbi:MAG: hypothetical protein IJ875_03045, partial [Solobacterium sp.]|nr:hypothetical protein [Solobacterium sp.]
HFLIVTFDAKIVDGNKYEDLAPYTAINDTDVEERATPNVGNDPVISDENHEGIPNTANYDIYATYLLDEEGNPVNDEEGNPKLDEEKPTHEDESNTVTVKPEKPVEPEKPEIEKYVNHDVHANLVEFDRIFKYDILAYVPNDADAIEINDTLVDALEFANSDRGIMVPAEKSDIAEEIVSSIKVVETNDHKVNGTVANMDDAMQLNEKANVKIDGKSLKVTVADATEYRGKYIQVTFWAKYTDEMIKAAEVGDSDTITDNGAVLEGADEHTGTTNQASYKIKVGDDWSSDHQSNVVTVEADKVNYAGAKAWEGTENNAWTSDVESVTFNLVKVNGDSREVVATVSLTKDEPVKDFPTQPKLINVTYDVEEADVKYYSEVKKGVAEADGKTTVTITNKPEKPEIEKYVNKDVHQDLGEFDRAFTYDIMAYVPSDATKVEITDTLVDALEFAKQGDGKGEATLEANEAVANVVVKEENNHKANGSVNEEGSEVAYNATIDGKTLVVTIEDEAAKGKWVQVTFYAKYTQAIIDSANAGEFKTIEDNGAVISEIASHTGTENKASYTIYVNNESEAREEYKDIPSNEVTVIPATVKYSGTKVWQEEWPENVPSVVFNLVKVDGDARTIVGTIELTKDEPTKTFNEVAKLVGVEYVVEEVANDELYTEINKEIDGTNVTITNKPEIPETPDEPDTPEIEKYVNQAVHKEISLDEIFTYDIQAYITKDAEVVTITDELNSDLQFVSTAEDVQVVLVGAENNHKPVNNIQAVRLNADATVELAGEAIYAEVTIDGRVLTIHIPDATALQGQWIRATFAAKIADGKKISDLKYTTITATDVEDRATPNTGNSPVLSTETHEGVPNKASYAIEVANEVKYRDDSNTVTVKPKTTEITVTKEWDDFDNELGLRSAVEAKLYNRGVDTGLTVMLTEENNWTAKFTNLDANGVYTVEETTKIYRTIPEVQMDGVNAHIINHTRPWIPETPDDGEKYTSFSLLKRVGAGLIGDKTYTIIVTIKTSEGTGEYEVELKPTDLYVFDYVPVGATVTVKEKDSKEYVATYYMNEKETPAVEFVAEENVENNIVIFNNAPKTPDKPTKPNVPTKPVIDTSDNQHTGLWTITLFLSMLALLGGIVLRKKLN